MKNIPFPSEGASCWCVPLRLCAAFVLVALTMATQGRLVAADSPAAAPSGPAVPLGLAMVANSPDSITLTWYRSPHNDATGYNVYGCDTADGTFTRLVSVTERTATLAKLAPGKTYYYKVSATSAQGESAPSPPVAGFTIAEWRPEPFPVRLATNMCLSLAATVLCNAQPLSGTPAHLVDGSDSTGCRLRKAFDLKIKLNPDIPIADAGYLMINFRTDCGPAEWSNDRFARTLKNYTILESRDSTTGEDGTWQPVLSGTNGRLDGVIVIPNHQPKWICLRSDYAPNEEVPNADDRRPMPSDLLLCRLAVFRSAPAGFRNDYWIFTGDSLVVQDLPGGAVEGRSAWFSDLVRQQHPDRYPIVVHVGRGGQMLKDTLPLMEKAIPELSPPNGTSTPTGTIVCWETGFNDVGVGGSLNLGTRLVKSYQQAFDLCQANGLIMVPVRIEYSNWYLNPDTLEPTRYNIFYNTLAVNLAGVDVFARQFTPYACDPATQLPFADYWSYTHKNAASVLVKKDGVHHTKEGNDGINTLWAEVADKMVYGPQQLHK
ncbi:hypothetical protein BH09VER1_BH09VER1_28050 [soil metagenome]